MWQWSALDLATYRPSDRGYHARHEIRSHHCSSHAGAGNRRRAATPPVPTISPVGRRHRVRCIRTPPSAWCRQPSRSRTFPYVTEEYFVSGTAAGAPYQTRIIVRRPKDPKAFSGTVVAEAQHAGGRSLIFEWSRVSVLTRKHLFVEIVHSPANVATLKTFNAERYAPLNIAMGQANEIIAQVGRAGEGEDRSVRGL